MNAQTDDPKFTLYWRDGKREVVTGRTAAEAMTLAGYGGGAARALDFHAKGDNREYHWDSKTREWNRLGVVHRINYGRLYPGKTYKADCTCGWSHEGERADVYAAVREHEGLI